MTKAESLQSASPNGLHEFELTAVVVNAGAQHTIQNPAVPR